MKGINTEFMEMEAINIFWKGNFDRCMYTKVRGIGTFDGYGGRAVKSGLLV